ncbi:SgcJ/EcaC family oxidoreductase [Cytobacillus dafuensis]|uniref:SgcJ/EcaC family oxidoreductase n=1 Tax=Cytobacillus dafuensis TaxID=1742359 RepID=A0A5B8Z0D4_CYTDA|nr:SgcJ/EcaC family oxidoreductase [Cytobacillus dafuensis]QED46177.1 SgcJ/EcaC family oxidoreductase [Cytobacillus dafuensis]
MDKAYEEIEALYHQLITAWNNRNAYAMSELFAEGGEMIGFDGSIAASREEIFSHLKPIFENHPTAPFISKVKNVIYLDSRTALLRAIAGMVPIGKTEINPSVNAHQTLVAVKAEEKWQIQLFQNTPAQFHGRPELAEQMTEELSELLK